MPRSSILYVGTLPPRPAGAAIMAGQILSGLAGLGHRVRALAPIVPTVARAEESFAQAHPEIELSRYTVPFFEGFPEAPPPREYWQGENEAVGSWLGPRLRQDPPDVVIVGSETYARYVPDIARAHGVPCVLLMHGGPSTAILAGTYPRTLADEQLRQYRKMDRLITMGRHWAESLRPLDLPEITVIPNPVDLDRFTPGLDDAGLRHALRLQPSDIVVLHPSNLGPVKRPLDLVWSAERAVPTDPRLVYLIAGDGPLREAMERACRERGILHRFRFVGWVEHDRMPAFMSLADMVVVPSQHETQALVYLEAQASGRPLVASAIPAALEVITPGRTGVLFERGDVGELARLTVTLAANSELRASIGRDARAGITPHALPTIVRRYAETIEQIVGGSKSAGAAPAQPVPRRATSGAARSRSRSDTT